MLVVGGNIAGVHAHHDDRDFAGDPEGRPAARAGPRLVLIGLVIVVTAWPPPARARHARVRVNRDGLPIVDRGLVFRAAGAAGDR